uniref:Galectin n=1 Tax=Lepisosteus oculatus TaxID=7918 RepID=W5NAC1_LEPOC
MTFVAPPGYQPLYNPTVPYLGPINGNLRAGMSIYIQGRVPHEITRLLLDTLRTEGENHTVTMSMWTVCLCAVSTDSSSVSESLCMADEDIDRDIFSVWSACSRLSVPQVNVNGRQFYLFQHRMPLERVSNLEIGGDVIIQSLNILGVREGGRKRGARMQGYPGGMGGGMQGGMQGYQGGMQDYPCGGMGGMGGGMQGYPSGGMGGMGGGGMGYPGANLPMISGAPVYNPPIPYSNMIPGGMTPKRTIIIRGMVPYGANRFHMNFMVGFSRDIAFHLNPRVAEGLVVRNSCLGGSWGQEESDLEFNPFQEGQYFEISVRCGNQRYKVFVNGQYLCDFFHRLQPFTQVDTLEVEGDVQLSYIHF